MIKTCLIWYLPVRRRPLWALAVDSAGRWTQSNANTFFNFFFFLIFLCDLI